MEKLHIRSLRSLRSLRKLLVCASMALGALFCAASAQAGNIWLTGHDADFHCGAGGAQCNHYGIAVDLVRSGAPDPTKPVLILDGFTDTASDAVRALGKAGTTAKNTIEGAGSAIPYVHMDPTSVGFAALPLSVSAYSAIIIPSFNTCGGCDLFADDVAAINARTADIAAFFNAGGGLAYFAGATAIASYYASVPVSATGIAVTSPFTLTAAGMALGLTNDDANCCATHNSFGPLGAGSPLIIAETDSAGAIETMYGRGLTIGDGGFSGVPEPSTVLLFGLGLLGLGYQKRRQAS